MTTQLRTASGREFLRAGTAVLQRQRLASATGGLWEAADLHWWRRRPRPSDDFELPFWADDDGPVAAVSITDWGTHLACDPLVADPDLLPQIWGDALAVIDRFPDCRIDILVDSADVALKDVVAAAGFSARGRMDGTGWLMAADRPTVPALVPGYQLVDRIEPGSSPHPMVQRNGPNVEERLRESSLYDPSLDLAVVAPNGEVAAYGLFWYDAVTSVGLVEPMRTEVAHERKGLARTVLAEGINRLAAAGAARMKVSYVSEAAQALYVGSGFTPVSQALTFVKEVRSLSA